MTFQLLVTDRVKADYDAFLERHGYSPLVPASDAQLEHAERFEWWIAYVRIAMHSHFDHVQVAVRGAA